MLLITLMWEYFISIYFERYLKAKWIEMFIFLLLSNENKTHSRRKNGGLGFKISF